MLVQIEVCTQTSRRPFALMAKTGAVAGGVAGSGLGCESAVGLLTASKKREYKVSNRIHEGKRPLYAVAFNFLDSRYFDVFDTVGGNRVTVYSCLEGGLVAVLQAYVDEDKDESFYTVCWACDIDGTPFLVAGGSNGIIRVINSGTEKIHKATHDLSHVKWSMQNNRVIYPTLRRTHSSHCRALLATGTQ